MAASKPIIASFDLFGQLYDILNEAKCGLIVEPNNFDQLVEAIIKLFEDRSLSSKLGCNGYKYIKEYASKEDCVEKYIETIFCINHNN